MIFFLMGHRGSGKTTALKFLPAIFIDLDEEIEKRHGPIRKIFAESGEACFRDLESRTLQEILRTQSLGAVETSQEDLVIALGAGFEGELPADARKIWIRRESDEAGRIFLGRPALEPGLPPLQEWTVRYAQREKKFLETHDDVITLPEGEWLLPQVMGKFWTEKHPSEVDHRFDHPVTVTLLPEDLGRWKDKLSYQRASLIEIREDLFTDGEIARLLTEIAPEKIYFSFRRNANMTSGAWLERFRDAGASVRTDWDLSLGTPMIRHWSYSLHERAFTPEEEKIHGGSSLLKWAPEVHDFRGLLEGHHWWLQDPQKRSFLPRSKDGRWRWYRRLFGQQMPIHFVRDFKGSAPDQPYLYETFLQKLGADGFAAVLGGPAVGLSWSPSFHHDFFSSMRMPFVSVPIGETEWDEAFDVLKKLGLRAAAVTSPHKKEAFKKVNVLARALDREFESLNTLAFKGQDVIGINTDLIGLKNLELQHRVSPEIQTVIWGGGGLLPVLKTVFPGALAVKARRGEILRKDSAIVWSSLRSEETKWPEPLHHVKIVLDMNYSENSMGRELALKAGCDYVSGEEFFKAQGRAQQEFWRSYL